MSYSKRNKKWESYRWSFLLSLLIHIVLFVSSIYLINLQANNPIINSVYLSYNLKEIENDVKKDINENVEDEKTNDDKISEDNSTDEFYNFQNIEYDTSNIKQIYKEYTLNVSLRYPNGWRYIDQNVKDKLDGVTFWADQQNYEYPPYVHLEVQDKYIFNPSRYKFKTEHNGNIFYYNDPEEMEDYYTQIIYIRTNTEEDYSLKLMVKGKETFLSFQPVFFSMAKSFSFGKSIF